MKGFGELSAKLIATVFFIGFIPFAPGTFGSLTGLMFVWFFRPSPLYQVMIAAVGFVIGAVSAQYVEKTSGQKDAKHIVIDEFVGYVVSVIYLPLTAGYLTAAFFLFRFFDILKPPPVRNVERAVHGGVGVMLDDVVAGVFANTVLQIVRVIGI